MKNLDDLMRELGQNPEDPEFQAFLEAARKHADYHEDHPDQCPHHAIVAPIVKEHGEWVGDQPGSCLDCKAYPVRERDTDCPLCKEER